jgi:alkanesulfonate monooxygenase SsuD/methylene tetrahydromethanopterin reductase-like flavin-dependent oxidoreductase (luciferase family)
VSARRGIFVAPFDELYEPALVAELAARAEARGWDGFFVWDHVAYRDPVRAVADPWVTLAAVAAATSRIAIGPMVTPVARRRPHQLARETVTLDHLSGGRLVLGVGLGSERTGEFDPARFGEEGDARARAGLLDSGLEKLLAFWDGGFEPPPVRGRIPVWVAVRWPHRQPLARAARHDGVFPIEVPSPEALTDVLGEIGRSDDPAYDVVVTNPPGVDPAPWEAAGATWCLTGFGPQPRADEVRAAIDAR